MRVAVTRHGLRTREALLDAGRTLADRDGLAAITISTVAEQARVAKGTFYVHFASREAFIQALQEAFDARMLAALNGAVADLAPGEARLLAGAFTYLDACLEDHAMKALAREASMPGRDASEREQRFVALIASNLAAMGWRDVQPAARLLMAMISELALIEHATGHKDHAARRAFRRYVQIAENGGASTAA